ncbi:MAG TPA: hypothetical protein VM163_07100 [bacterium]|nr:hypothetical protein [bacterium]
MAKKLLLLLAVVVVAYGIASAQEVQQVTLHCPVYLTWASSDSFIVVRNTTGTDVSFTPGFCFDGEYLVPYTLIPVPAHGTIILTVDQFFDTSICESGLVGVELSYMGEPGAIMGSVVMFLGSMSFQVPFRDVAADVSHSLHSSLCLGGDFIDYVFVKNTTNEPVTVSPTFYCNGAATPGLSVRLNPHQAAMVSAGAGHLGDCIGGADLVTTATPGSIVAVNIAANLMTGMTLVEELLPGVGGLTPPPTYNLFVANGLSYTLSAVNTETGEVKVNFASTGDVPNYLSFHNDDLYCVNSLSNNVQVFSPATGDALGEIDLDVGTNPWAMAFTSGDKAFVTGYYTDNVVILDLASQEQAGTIDLGENARSPEGICLADGKLYVSSVNYDLSTYSYGQGVVTVIDPETMQTIKTLQTSQLNPQVIQNDGQGELYVLCTGDWFSQFGVVDVIDTATDEIVTSLPVGGSPGCMVIAPNNCAYIGDASDANLYKIDVATNTVLHDSEDPIVFSGKSASAAGLVASSAGYLYISSFGEDTVYIMDYRTDGMIRMIFSVGDGPGALAILN